MKEQMSQYESSKYPTEEMSSVEKYIFDKTTSPAPGEGLTYGDLRLARSMLRDEISALQKQSSASTPTLDRKLALYKKIEVAEQKLLDKINAEQNERTKHIAHYGTYLQDEFSDEGFNAVSAVEALREANPAEWVEPVSTKASTVRKTSAMRHVDAQSDAYKKTLLEKERLEKQYAHERDTRDVNAESANNLGTQSTQLGYFARLTAAFKKTFLDEPRP